MEENKPTISAHFRTKLEGCQPDSIIKVVIAPKMPERLEGILEDSVLSSTKDIQAKELIGVSFVVLLKKQFTEGIKPVISYLASKSATYSVLNNTLMVYAELKACDVLELAKQHYTELIIESKEIPI